MRVLRTLDLLLMIVFAAAGTAGAAGSGGREERSWARLVCSERLLSRLETANPDDTLAVWIYFRDRRGAAGSQAVSPAVRMSPRAWRRRMLRGSAGGDIRDLPVHSGYIDELRGRVFRIRHSSRYFNAASVDVSVAALPALSGLECVRRIDLVASWRAAPPIEDETGGERSAAVATPPVPPDIYGLSRCQLEQIGAIRLLDRGFNGSGAAGGSEQILIAILDTGFRLDHMAFRQIDIEGKYDFIQGDSIVANEPDDHPNQDGHGTAVLGVIAGRSDFRLYGPAWGARYLLAKTEIVGQEIPVEEDHWVAGIEWADSAGADIVTSSLGYIDWYTRDSLDGETALCTQAADIAASHGIVVVNSAGNLGFAGLVAPADGDSVLAVGAVDCGGSIAYFSSRGPTADGRIKPDFAAMGYGVLSVAHSDTLSFTFYNGTSFAAPLVAGICAQLLEARPDWDFAKLRDGLRATASRSGFPDNTYGYGIPDAALASRYPESFAVPAPFPNPFSSETRLQLSSTSGAPIAVKVYDCRGALVRVLAEGRPVGTDWTVAWDGTNDAGRRVASGVYFIVATSRELERTMKVLYVK